MIIEGRMVAVILIYIFTFLGYLLGQEFPSEKSKELETKKKKLEIIKAYLQKENKDE